MQTKLFIEIKTQEPVDRRRLNNILAAHESDIFYFITREGASNLHIPGDKYGVKYELNLKITE